MEKLSWGVLGCANFARKRTIPALLETPSAHLAGVASRGAERAAEFRAQFGLERAYASYEALLGDPGVQAVYIPLPNGLHADWTIRAVEAGKHVVCEKPFAADAAEARRVAEAAARSGRRVMEAFMWRFHPQHLRARALVDSGAIGTVQLVRGAFSFPLDRGPNVRWRPELAGGSLMDLGCYPISAARFYLGREPLSAWARGEIDAEFGVDRRVAGCLEFPGGRALFDCAFDLPFRPDLEIVGERGTLHFPRAWQPERDAAAGQPLRRDVRALLPVDPGGKRAPLRRRGRRAPDGGPGRHRALDAQRGGRDSLRGGAARAGPPARVR
jgi:predicted dehydrogenase